MPPGEDCGYDDIPVMGKLMEKRYQFMSRYAAQVPMRPSERPDDFLHVIPRVLPSPQFLHDSKTPVDHAAKEAGSSWIYSVAFIRQLPATSSPPRHLLAAQCVEDAHDSDGSNRA